MENVPTTIEPELDMTDGAKAADALLKIVKKAGLARKFGGEKEHLFYEAWQSLARFYHSSVRTFDAQPVTIGETSGAKAKAEIIDDATGKVTGGAEAYCMRDEKNWKDKPWFQLASMAQTRAGSKACRNKWAFVPAMVGFATTPAEEMDEVKNGHSEQKTKSQDASGPTIPPPPISNEPASPAQIGKINVELSRLGIKGDYERHNKVAEILNLNEVPETLKALTKKEASKVIEVLIKEKGE